MDDERKPNVIDKRSLNRQSNNKIEVEIEVGISNILEALYEPATIKNVNKLKNKVE